MWQLPDTEVCVVHPVNIPREHTMDYKGPQINLEHLTHCDDQQKSKKTQ